eukprot:CAMPEP_0172717398 /NCGR_PEP_ID=MMETSP1074-20121228/71347_1 /TAXON_ID=2916 /ORGANISM="Ceratium fusus, Strain PA161109" /LENGTH=81 /DNA_ID=CAMNT_0013542333 /DNA_START=23 /DNA_END=265 /DNA_ORIENTATION=+
MASLVPSEPQVDFVSHSVWGCEEHHLSTVYACLSGPFDEPDSPMDSTLRHIRRKRAFSSTMHAKEFTRNIQAGQPQGVPQQ